MNKVLREVQQERDREDSKWGEQNHTPIEWNVILNEEVGEVAKEVCESYWERNSSIRITRLKAMREELIQVAAVAVAMVESLDRNQLSGKPPFMSMEEYEQNNANKD